MDVKLFFCVDLMQPNDKDSECRFFIPEISKMSLLWFDKKRLLIYRRLFSVVQCDTMFYLLSVLKLRYFLKRVKDL